MEFPKCERCERSQHPDYLHLETRDCQIALAASLGAVTEFAQNLERSLMRRISQITVTNGQT